MANVTRLFANVGAKALPGADQTLTVDAASVFGNYSGATAAPMSQHTLLPRTLGVGTNTFNASTADGKMSFSRSYGSGPPQKGAKPGTTGSFGTENYTQRITVNGLDVVDPATGDTIQTGFGAMTVGFTGSKGLVRTADVILQLLQLHVSALAGGGDGDYAAIDTGTQDPVAIYQLPPALWLHASYFADQYRRQRQLMLSGVPTHMSAPVVS